LLGLAPAECVVVEDSPSGIAAGLAAGCRVLGILGTRKVNELHAATWIVSSLEDIAVSVLKDGVELRVSPVAALDRR